MEFRGINPLEVNFDPRFVLALPLRLALTQDDVLCVGVTPQAAGLYQLVIRVPATATPGKNLVVLTVYGKSTPVGPVVPVAAP